MGATLADGGVNPLTKERLVDPIVCHYTLAVMATAGLYETSGDWLYDIGLPGKSGIGGGIVTVSPGKGGLGTFAPPLDQPATASRGNWSPSSCPRGWDWTCSYRNLRIEKTGSPGFAGRSNAGQIRRWTSHDRRCCRSRGPPSRGPRILGADDRDRARPGDHVVQRRLLASRHRRHGAELRRAADHGGHGDRHVLARGRGLRHAGRQARPAFRGDARVPRRGGAVRRRPGADDVQPGRDRDAGGAGLGGPRRGGDRPRAGRADRQPLPRPAAGDGRRCAGLGARRRRRRRVPDRRPARHLHRLAPRVRAPDRGLGDRVHAELQAEAGRRPARTWGSTSWAWCWPRQPSS